MQMSFSADNRLHGVNSIVQHNYHYSRSSDMSDQQFFWNNKAENRIQPWKGFFGSFDFLAEASQEEIGGFCGK